VTSPEAPGWPVGDLSPAEQALWAAFPRGAWADLRTGDPAADDLVTAASWEPGRVVRAEIICALLLGASRPEPGYAPAVRLRGARVTGHLDLMGATVTTPLVCEYCCFDQEIRLVESTTKTVRIVASRLPGLNGTRMRTDGILNFRASVIGSVLRLDQAQVSGQVSVREATIGDGRGVAGLLADRLSVDGDFDGLRLTAHGSVSLRGARIDGSLELDEAEVRCPGGLAIAAGGIVIGHALSGVGLLVDGETRIHNAHVGSYIQLSRATLHNPGGLALSGGGLTVPGGMFCRDGFTVDGEVKLISARLGDALSVRDATMRNPGGMAFRLEHVTVRNCDATGLSCYGEVSLMGAVISTSLTLAGAQLDNSGGMALRLSLAEVGADLGGDGMSVSGELSLDGATVRGQVSLRQVRLANPGGDALNARGLTGSEFILAPAGPVAGAVDLSHAHVDIFRDEPAAWPAQLNLDGFTYRVLEPRLRARERLGWLARTSGPHEPQPYEQLAASYTSNGQHAEARSVLYSRERQQRAAMTPPGRAWSFIQDITVAYGYKPWRALIWLAVLLAAGSVVFSAWPPAPLQPSAAPHFIPVIYTLNLLIPVVDLGQRDAFNPSGAEQWLSYLLIAAGWILATTVATGAARVLNRQ
jgi:hypothetical protein